MGQVLLSDKTLCASILPYPPSPTDSGCGDILIVSQILQDCAPQKEPCAYCVHNTTHNIRTERLARTRRAIRCTRLKCTKSKSNYVHRKPYKNHALAEEVACERREWLAFINYILWSRTLYGDRSSCNGPHERVRRRVYGLRRSGEIACVCVCVCIFV